MAPESFTGDEKPTYFHFYMHDDYGGANPSSAKVVSGPPAMAGAGPRFFGDIVVLNNALTEGPEATSRAVGRAQGFAARVSRDGTVSELVMTVVFEEEGPHKGSTITVLGLVDLSLPVRELPIVGGTGVFRLVRGHAFTKSHDYNLDTGGAVEMEFHLIHN
ncbi:dirigent protein 23-like [Zingiber officinale]|uniref:Dirigent protein n=1 Tax=Zingiber officinale TaxID=94328 RepID=A0A8J5L7J0_ZINOF|nr:dirigent protein 23-like [Zingiber officinale]KAG6516225.1 hypothetical protein ZIOFF_026678 [Zingiber officinale]